MTAISTSTIRVLHVDLEKGWRGGQRQVFLLVKGLAAEKGLVQKVVVRAGGALAERLKGVTDVLAVGNPVAAIGSVLSEIVRFRPDVLHVHSPLAHDVAALATLLLPLGGPKPARVVTRRVLFEPSSRLWTRYKYLVWPDFVVCISEAVRSVMKRFGVPQKKLRVIYSGLPSGSALKDSPIKKELRRMVGGGRFLVGIVGALTPEKGHRLALKAFASSQLSQSQKAVLLLVGDGPEKEQLQSLVLELGIQASVKFLGEREDAEDILASLDLLLVPSHSEGLGTVAVEARLRGVPVIASRVGGLVEVLGDGSWGELVEPGDVRAWVEALDRFAAYPSVFKERAIAGVEDARACFSDQVMVSGYISMYRDIAQL